MTRDRYLEMCEQLGKEPNPDEIPPDYEDFPEIVSYAIQAFNLMGDRIYPDIGYIGKDYTTLQIFVNTYGIEDTDLFLEILNYLDSRAIDKAQTQLKAEREKLKRKHSGPKRS